MQYIINFYKLSTSRLGYPTILTETFLTSLLALNLKEDPLA